MPLPQNSAEAVKAIQDYGQQQYRQSNYVEALEAFSKALELAPRDRVGILDNRAATYCRLKVPDYKRAFADASRMIREAKSDARGYLRAGKVLHLKDEPTRAMAIYGYALKALHPDCREREVISKLLQKLDRRVNGPKLVDPFQAFPAELVSLVLLFLDLKSLLASSRVSKLWHEICCSMHWLWYHLDLSIAKRRVSPKHVLRLIARSKSSIKKATLHNVVVAELQLFSDALLTCRKLKEISLNYVPPASLYINPRQPLLRDTRALRIEFESQVNQFKKIAEGCPQLEDVKISFSDCPSSASFTMPYLPRLRSLHCVVHNDVSRLVFHMLYKDANSEQKPSATNYEEIRFQSVELQEPIDFSNCNQLRVLFLAKCSISPSQSLPRTLEHLFVMGTVPLNLFQYVLPNLKTISLVSVDGIYPRLSQLLLHCKDSIEALSLKESLPENPSEFETIFSIPGYLSKLKDLNLQGIFEVNDTMVHKVISSAPNLKRLNLSATSVTGHGIRMLAQASDFKLEQLVINSLLQRPNEADVHYARQHGIDIPPIRHWHM